MILAELNWLEISGIALLALSALVFALILLAAACIGNEPDVNGDPERDAGYSDEEIESMSEVWDRGSCRTAETTKTDEAPEGGKHA